MTARILFQAGARDALAERDRHVGEARPPWDLARGLARGHEVHERGVRDDGHAHLRAFAIDTPGSAGDQPAGAVWDTRPSQPRPAVRSDPRADSIRSKKFRDFQENLWFLLIRLDL